MNIIFFAGAGMAKPLGLPTVVDFNEMINKTLDERELNFINNIKKYISYKKLNSNDIEYIFSSIAKFLGENAEVTVFLLNTLTSIDFIGNINNFIKLARSSNEKLKKIFYESLTNFDINKAKKLYVSIFKGIKQSFNTSNISFITTNYDSTFDEVVKRFKSDLVSIGFNDIDTLFKPYENIAITYQPSDNDFPSQSIEYIKLHGSIDWFKDNDNITFKIFAPIKPAYTDKSVLIYPGFKGFPDEEPFKSLHERFKNRLSKANIMIAVGFAFRDEAINNIIEPFLKKGLKIYHINPTPPDRYPPESKTPYFLKNYPDNFFHIQKSVSPENLEDLLKNVSHLHQR